MISFSCSHCGMKLKVKPEFAGRSSRCPTCKQPLVVPGTDKTQADVAAGQIDGTDSSLAKAGVVDGGINLGAAACPGQQSIGELLRRRTKKDGRYIIEGEIARGGMGAVLRAVDCDIRREVAGMGLGSVNALLVRLVFRHSLLQRAYTRNEFEHLFAQAGFRPQDVEVNQGLTGLEMTLHKPAP